MNLRNILNRLFAQSFGFTLMEVSLSLGILSLGLGLVGTSIFQVFDIQRSWQDQRVATKETRHAASTRGLKSTSSIINALRLES